MRLRAREQKAIYIQTPIKLSEDRDLQPNENFTTYLPMKFFQDQLHQAMDLVKRLFRSNNKNNTIKRHVFALYASQVKRAFTSEMS